MPIFESVTPKSYTHRSGPKSLGGTFWNLSKCKQLFISLSPSYTRQDCRSPGIWQQKHRRRTLSGCRRSSKAGWSHLLPPVWGWNDPCCYWQRVFWGRPDTWLPICLGRSSALGGRFLFHNQTLCDSRLVFWNPEEDHPGGVYHYQVTQHDFGLSSGVSRQILTNEQARKARICFSYLQSETISHSLTRQG